MARLAAEIGSPGVLVREEEGSPRWRVYLPAEASPELTERARTAWRALAGQAAARPVLFEEPERDWGAEARRGFRGTRVGPFWIGPPWARPPGGSKVLVVNPGRAFGTGLHPTTRIALRLLARGIQGRAGARGRTLEVGAPPTAPGMARSCVLDVGTGSGVLALAALSLGAGAALGLDLDSHALANAAENRALNGAEGRLRLITGSLESVSPSSTFGLVLANLEHAILIPLLPELARRLTPEGALIASGLTLEQSRVFAGAASRAGLARRRAAREAGWWGALLEHRTRRAGAPQA